MSYLTSCICTMELTTNMESVTCSIASNSTSCSNDIRSTPAPGPTLPNLVWTYMGPIVFVIGIIGNILVLLVMTRRRMLGTSTSTYLITMSLIDTIVLCSGMIPPFLAAINVARFETQPSPICKISKFCEYSAGDAAIWIRVQFTLDRFVAICFPMRKTKWCLQWRAKFYALTAIVVAMIKNAHVFWTRGVKYQSITVYANRTVENATGDYLNNNVDGTSNRILTTLGVNDYNSLLATDNQTILVWVSNCDYPTPEYAQFEKYIRPYILVTLLGIIPLVAIALSNIFIVRQLIVLRRVRRKMSTSKQGNQSLFQTTFMCLTASVSFFLFVTPTIILIIGRPYWNVPVSSSYQLAGTVCNLTYFLNFGINCYLYCLIGKRFRDTLLAMLRCKNTKPRSSSAGNVSTYRKNASAREPSQSQQGSQAHDRPQSDDTRNENHPQPDPDVFIIGCSSHILVDSSQKHELDTENSVKIREQINPAYINGLEESLNGLESGDEFVVSVINAQTTENNVTDIAIKFLQNLSGTTPAQQKEVFKRGIEKYSTMPKLRNNIQFPIGLASRRSYSNRYSRNGSDAEKIISQDFRNEESPNSDQSRRFLFGESWI